VDKCILDRGKYVGTAAGSGNSASIENIYAFSGCSTACVDLRGSESSTPAGTLNPKSVTRLPHRITNSLVFPPKHKKAAFAVVLSLAVEWLI
jgi:hypothetical protein